MFTVGIYRVLRRRVRISVRKPSVEKVQRHLRFDESSSRLVLMTSALHPLRAVWHRGEPMTNPRRRHLVGENFRRDAEARIGEHRVPETNG